MADSVGTDSFPYTYSPTSRTFKSLSDSFILSPDRVFVHALNTVKKIPKTGASRPPPADRLRLYGLYKQAMEGDVDGVMDRPSSDASNSKEETQREKDKYDAWDAQRGVSRTEAKRRYIEALIDTMHKYASPVKDARALVEELEFVWDQIKNNTSSSAGSSPTRPGEYSTGDVRRFEQPRTGADGPMRVLSPMSQDDEAERDSEQKMDEDEEEEDGQDEGQGKKTKWRRTMETALVRMTTEIAALREQITTGREYQGRRARSIGSWIGWLLWLAIRHFLVDAALLGILLIWLRRKKDKRFEDLVRQAVRIGREYIRKVLPER